MTREQGSRVSVKMRWDRWAPGSEEMANPKRQEGRCAADTWGTQMTGRGLWTGPDP